MRRYWPVSSVVAEYWFPWAISTATTLAFGRTPPCGSVTVPLMLPDVPTPCPDATGVAISQQPDKIKAHANEISFLMTSPFESGHLRDWTDCRLARGNP